MTTMTISDNLWETLEEVDPSAVSVTGVTDTEITIAVNLGASTAEFVLTGSYAGMSGLALDGLTGTVTGIRLAIDGLEQFDAQNLAVDVTEVTEEALSDVAELVEIAFDDGVDMDGSDDDDLLDGADGDDTIDGGHGADDILGELGDDDLGGDDGDDTIDGGDGDDDCSGGIGDDDLYGGSGRDNLRGNSGHDYLNGGGAADTLLGGTGDDDLRGGGGDDHLDSGDGIDTLAGGLGDDDYFCDVEDIIEELADGGVDTVYAGFSELLGDWLENLVLTGAADLNGIGNSLDNLLRGNSGSNSLSGGQGSDDVVGGGGDDDLSGDSGRDDLRGGRGSDDIAGDSGSDSLSGGAGADTLAGGIGDDVLDGDDGNDVLIGGAGDDVFVCDDSGGDRIRDFVSAEDVLHIDNGLYAALVSTGLLSGDHFAANDAGVAMDADDHIVFETDTGRLFYDADGSGAGSAVLIARLTGGATLSVDDIVVV